MSGMERRLQLLLDHARYERVAAAAEKEGISVSAAIRHALDVTYPDDALRRREGARRFLELADLLEAEALRRGEAEIPFDKNALLDDAVAGIE
jgi:hypothetical protein